MIIWGSFKEDTEYLLRSIIFFVENQYKTQLKCLLRILEVHHIHICHIHKLQFYWNLFELAHKLFKGRNEIQTTGFNSNSFLTRLLEKIYTLFHLREFTDLSNNQILPLLANKYEHTSS